MLVPASCRRNLGIGLTHARNGNDGHRQDRPRPLPLRDTEVRIALSATVPVLMEAGATLDMMDVSPPGAGLLPRRLL